MHDILQLSAARGRGPNDEGFARLQLGTIPTAELTARFAFAPQLDVDLIPQLRKNGNGIRLMPIIHHNGLGRLERSLRILNRPGIHPFHLHIALAAKGAGAHGVGQIKAAFGQRPPRALPPEHTASRTGCILDDSLQVLTGAADESGAF